MVLELGFDAKEILAVTYTNAATEEMKARVRLFFSQALLVLTNQDQADIPSEIKAVIDVALKNRSKKELINNVQDTILCFDEIPIFTIHGFCQRLIAENAFESKVNFDLELVADISDILDETVEDFYRQKFNNLEPELADYLYVNKITPTWLKKKLNNRFVNPFYEVRPISADLDFLDQLSSLRQLFSKAKMQWQENRASIIKLLNSPTLNKKSYKVASISSLVSDLDLYFAQSYPSLKISTRFVLVTNTKIESSTNKGQSLIEHELFMICDEFMKEAVSIKDSFENYLNSQLVSLYEYAKNQVDKKKLEHDLCSFDDLLLTIYYALESDEKTGLQQVINIKYKAVLIDEFQDTDSIQYTIFKNLFDEAKIMFFIGDPKQAIYGFRGADINTYLAATTQIEPNSCYSMKYNYRSEPNLINAINHLFNQSQNPFINDAIKLDRVESAGVTKDLLTENSSSRPPLNIWYQKPLKEGSVMAKGTLEPIFHQSIAKEILGLLDQKNDVKLGEHPIKPKDIAILVRAGREGMIIKDTLDSVGIPSVLSKQGNIYASDTAIAFYYVLVAIAYPENQAYIKAALLSAVMNESILELETILENNTEWEGWVNRFFKYHNIWHNQGFMVMYRRFIKDNQIESNLLQKSNGERQLTNLNHLAELLHAKANSSKIYQLLEFFEESIIKVGLGNTISPEHELRLESDENAVQILTYHKSKGLEFPVVFLGVDPLAVKNQSGTVTKDHEILISPSEQDLEVIDNDSLAENMRLLYVALTRAKNRCYICWSKMKGSETSAFAYLFHGSSSKTLYKERLDQDLFSDIQALGLNDNINVCDPPVLTLGNTYHKPAENIELKQLKKFKYRVPDGWQVNSFSSLSRSYVSIADRELPELDSWFSSEKEIIETPSIFNFPKGAKAGNFMHEILENIDFQGQVQERCLVVDAALDKYNFKNYRGFNWQPVLLMMLDNVLNTNIVDTNNQATFKLADIEKAALIKELEFYFPVSNKSKEKVSSLINIDLTKKQLAGYLKGFIDLIFCYNNKYYILDWKSNYLGSDLTDYNNINITKSMTEHNYVLQYYIYITAVNKYLRTRLKDYSYEQDFGGVYYLFLRGINKKKSGYGIYFDKPKKSEIEGLEYALSGK
jgi:exodeoxyribonuclease V beta subunit